MVGTGVLRSPFALSLTLGCCALAACAPSPSSSSAEGTHPPDGGEVESDGGALGAADGGITLLAEVLPPASDWGRDWAKHPAIVEQATFTTLYALSDVHGGYDRLWALLAKWSLIPGQPASPAAAAWSGGDATLVVTGDLIDKGPSGLEVITYLRALEVAATNAGGHLIVTLGNHEAEFLVDPLNSKAAATDGVDPELMSIGQTPLVYASAADPNGAWLRARPFAVRVEKWFFSHAGDTGGRSVAQLEAALRPAVDAHAYDDPEIIGTSSILESRAWYASDVTLAGRYAQAVGASHLVFGHDPNALGARGAIAVDGPRTLFRIDCGMSPGVDDSKGVLFRVSHSGVNEVAEELRAGGTVTSPPLYTGP